MGKFVVDSLGKLWLVAHLLKTNNQELEHLLLKSTTDNEIKSCLSFILPHFGQHLTHLQSFAIDACNRTVIQGVNGEIVLIIDKHISCLNKIELFHLSSSGICSAIAGPLLNNSHIQILRFCDCQIGDEGAEILAGVLQHHQCALKELKLDGNDIGDRGCCAIMDALHHHHHSKPSLRSLGLDYNARIGVEGSRAIARALQNRSVKLERLKLDDNRSIDDDACICIASALAENVSLKTLDLCGCYIFNKGWNAMEQAFQKNYSLHELTVDVCCVEKFEYHLAFNRNKPVQAKATKTGIFPVELLSSYREKESSSAACDAEMLSKIISYGNLSVLFSFLHERPSILPFVAGYA